MIFNFLVLIFVSINNNFKFNKIKIFVAYFSLFIIGFLSFIFLTIILDLINFVKLNYYILLRITNPFHYMVEFHASDFPSIYGDMKVGISYFINLFSIAVSNLDYNFFKIIILF